MCLAAAAVPVFTSIAGLAISGVSTVAGIMQSQQQAAMQASQARQQARLAAQQQSQQANYAYRKAQQEANFQRQMQQQQFLGQQRAYQAAQASFQRQIANNNRASNLAYTTEQMKLNEKRAELAFKSQEIYAKQIGDTGRILATGMVGNSVGALVRDAEAQGGFALAQEAATYRSAEQQGSLAMKKLEMDNQTANNNAFSSLPLPPIQPTPIPDPIAPPGATIGVNTRF